MKAATRLAALAFLAAIAAVPTVPLSRTYLCFFDAGSAELEPRCQSIAREIASALKEPLSGEELGSALVPAGATRVELAGHTDAAEAAAGKASLSRARAEAVAALLRFNGVPADAIETASFGATRPLVPAAGAEPQNRRVEFRYR